MAKLTIERKRLFKTVTWRILAVSATIIISLVFTHSINISLGIGTVDAILKTIMYYLHERAWDRVELTAENNK